MTELNEIEKKEGEYLSLEEFLKLEYNEINRETLKEDLAYIINNFHNLARKFGIEPVRNFEYFVVEYESATTRRGAEVTTTVRTPAPQEKDLNRQHINPNNTLAKVEYRDMNENVQPLFRHKEAPLYLDMTQRVLRESPQISQNEE